MLCLNYSNNHQFKDHTVNSCKKFKSKYQKINTFKLMYGLSGNDQRDASISSSYLTA